MSRIYIDSADEAAVAEWLGSGLAQGVTTNASIIRRDGGSSLAHIAKRLLCHSPIELHMQVLAEEDDDAFGQAVRLAAIDSRVRVKIPILTSMGRPRIKLIRRCVLQGIPVNVTACTALGQALAVSALGPGYVSLFWGRVRDGSADPATAVAQFVLPPQAQRPSLIVGSLRSADDVTDSWLAGADIITVSPRLIHEWTRDPGSIAIAEQFQRDGVDLVI